MRAMIMAAGAGSRLMPLTANLPKPMVPMANRPLMENIVQVLATHGFDEIMVNLHCHAPSIKGHFHDGRDFGVALQYSEEEELLGTAGGVKRCEWFLNDTFVVMSGDALTDVDLTGLLEAHRRRGAIATIALKRVENVEDYGVVIVSSDGRITSFQEKPRREEALSQVVNTGIYVFEPEIFTYIPPGQFYDFGRQVFPHLVQSGAPFYGHVIEDYWCDVGNVEAYRQAHADILFGQVRYAARGQVLEGSRGTRVLLGEGVKMGKGVVLKGYVAIGPNCQVGDHVTIENSVVWEDAILEDACELKEAVVGRGCLLARSAVVNSGSVIV